MSTLKVSASHSVAQGEHVATIARKHGFVTWQTIYDHPDNAALRDRRPDPNVLLPGDEIAIPPKRLKWQGRPTTAVHQFHLKPVPTRLKVVLRRQRREPFANEPYTLTLFAATATAATPGEEARGTTDGDGLIDIELPPRVAVARLTLDKRPWLVWTLRTGHLDPAKEPATDECITTGVQARLNNLGYWCGAIDGDVGPKTTAAIAMFQRVALERTDADGALDGATADALAGRHRS